MSMRAERFENGPMQYLIKGIEDDMGEGKTLDIVIRADGDAILTIWDPEKGPVDITFNTFQGGSHTPGLATRLRFVAEFTYASQKDPHLATKLMMENLNKPEGEKL